MAPSDMFPAVAEMAEDVGIAAPGLFQGIGQDRQPLVIEKAGGHQTIIVNGLGQAGDGRSSPRWVEGDGAEGVAEDTPEQFTLARSATDATSTPSNV
jgi:hypothetical protein